MKSLHTRLDPIQDEVLEYTATYGRFEAMTRFKVASYDRFVEWLKEVTGDENYGINPKLRYELHRTLGDQLWEAAIRTVVELKAQIAERDKRIAFLEWQLSHSADKEKYQALALLQACEV